VDPVKYESVV
jgi:hypothetical protein